MKIKLISCFSHTLQLVIFQKNRILGKSLPKLKTLEPLSRLAVVAPEILEIEQVLNQQF